jgi:ABC-type antimicrobial peptide transport system permease subunit
LSCARKRRHDFAVLRVLGMTRGGVRVVLNSQATAIAMFGLVFGIPLGLAVGRIGWRSITERVPLLDVAPLALVAALLIIPATIVVANLLAFWPGRVVLSCLPGEVLRAE